VGSNPTPSANAAAPGLTRIGPATDRVSTLGHRRVIEPEQVAGALERLDPRERELLALSLRRRVPDDALARVYDVDSQEVARRRAGAIERLADELGAQRGEDLGAVLQALLDEGTWTAADLLPDGDGASPDWPVAAADLRRGDWGGEAEPHEPEAEPDTPEPEAEADAPEADPRAPEEAPLASAPEPAAPEPAEDPAPALAAVQAPEATPESSNGQPPVVPAASEPVLEMLAAREGIRGPDAKSGRGAPTRKRRVPYLPMLGGFAAAVIGGAAAFVGSSNWGDQGGTASLRSSGDDGTKHFVPQLGGPLEAPFPSEPQSISCYSTAFVYHPTTLYREPGGRVRIRLSSKTEWDSDRVLGVVLRRGDWVAVQAPELGNSELAWMPAKRARLDCVSWSMHADLSRRMLVVERDDQTVRRFRIGIGRRENPTPRGRFSVTDKLRVTDSGSPYGCCVLALTGHQTHLPAAWPGGDRLAIHATRELSSIGKPASLGCLRITSAQARWLIRTIPLGAPLFVET
jgi:L,D-transpeptidase catalytic domain